MKVHRNGGEYHKDKAFFAEDDYMMDIDWFIWGAEGNIIKPVAILEVTRMDRVMSLKLPQLRAIKSLARKAEIKSYLLLYTLNDKNKIHTIAKFDLDKYQLQNMDKELVRDCFVTRIRKDKYSVNLPGKLMDIKEYAEFEHKLRGKVGCGGYHQKHL